MAPSAVLPLPFAADEDAAAPLAGRVFGADPARADAPPDFIGALAGAFAAVDLAADVGREVMSCDKAPTPMMVVGSRKTSRRTGDHRFRACFATDIIFITASAQGLRPFAFATHVRCAY